jgi:hypothetical protein
MVTCGVANANVSLLSGTGFPEYKWHNCGPAVKSCPRDCALHIGIQIRCSILKRKRKYRLAPARSEGNELGSGGQLY